MKYFKNTELAKLYHVSEKSVRNWIEAAQGGKLELQLFENNGRGLIANTSKNTALIEKLVEKGRKYKNTRGLEIIYPKEELYGVYSPQQVLDIISNLTVHHEIPRQYNYLDGGAKYWDQYTKRLASDGGTNIITATEDLLDEALKNIEATLDPNKKVNVIDLGPGNGYPIRSTLAYLLKRGRLNRYVAVDISQTMLDIAEKNVRSWFGDAVKFEGYVRDFSYERFDDLFLDTHSKSIPVNLVFLLGGTLSNFRQPDRILQVVNDSLGRDDLFFYTGHLDTPKARRFFDFNPPNPKQKLFLVRILFDFLNIDEELYDVEEGFSEEKRERFCLVRPKKDITIEFKMSNMTERVELHKNEAILLWRHLHYRFIDFINLFDSNSFDFLQATRSNDQEYLLLVTKIKTDPSN